MGYPAVLAATDPLLMVEGGPDPLQQAANGFLIRYRNDRTRRAYRSDLAHFVRWCHDRDLEPLSVRPVHVEAYARHAEEVEGLALSTVARRLTTLSRFFRAAVIDGHLASAPTEPVTRPVVDSESPTLALDKDEAQRLLSASEASGLRDHALVALLLFNGLRISEALGALAEDLGNERGHRTLAITRKGGKRRTVPLAPPTTAALDAYLAGRVSGPLFRTETRTGCVGGRALDRRHAARIVQRLARQAGLAKANRLSPHSLRHTAITAALDAGVSLRDVQDYAGHADPRTTRRYDRARHSLDRHATYALAAYLADG